jgi:hypothetical protein
MQTLGDCFGYRDVVWPVGGSSYTDMWMFEACDGIMCFSDGIMVKKDVLRRSQANALY